MTDERSADRGQHAIEWLKHDPSRPYLGDRAVIWRILSEMVETTASEPDKSVTAIAQAAAILTGQDDSYAPMGPWNTKGIGTWIRGHMNGVPDGDAYTAVEYALAHLVLHQWDLIRGMQDGLDEKAAGERFRFLVTNWMNLMLGIPHMAPEDPDDQPREDDDDPEPEDDDEPEGEE
jgi:hypothetical protein